MLPIHIPPTLKHDRHYSVRWNDVWAQCFFMLKISFQFILESNDK